MLAIVNLGPDGVYAAGRDGRVRVPRGLVVGRSLLYPSARDVAAAVDTAVSLL